MSARKSSVISVGSRPRRLAARATLVASVALALVATTAPEALLWAQEGSAILFPEPFLVEHAVHQGDRDGWVHHGETVTDYYGGHWIVSVRGDGSRRIVDLERAELIEVLPDEGVYSVITFSRRAELSRRLAELVGARLPSRRSGAATASAVTASVATGAEPRSVAGSTERMELFVTEVPIGEPTARATSTRTASASELRAPANEAWRERGVRRLRVAGRGVADRDSRASSGATEPEPFEVWVDPRFQFSEAAASAFERLERSTSSVSAEIPGASPLEYLAAARRFAGFALPVRTRRPVDFERGLGWIEDVAIRVERLEVFPTDLIEVPAELRRAPHGLELAVVAAEREAEIDRLLGGSR